MTTLQVPQPFDFHQQISEVVLVGCGGTGSQVARTLCRIVYDLRRRGHHVPSIKFVDPDKIDVRNIGRQMYVENDISKFKATTLATRFNLALGLNVVAYAEPFDAEKHAGRYGTLVIGCVDNHLARIELNKTRGILLDAGNSRVSGQVSLGNTNNRADVMRCIKSNQFTHLPNAGLIFPQLLEPEPESDVKPVSTTESCAALVEISAQALLVNDMICIIAGEYIYKMLNRLPILSFLTYVDTESLSMRSVPITTESILTFLG